MGYHIDVRATGILVCLVLSAPGTQAQTGYLDNSPVWTCMTRCNPGGVAHCFSTDLYNYFLCGDTIVSGTSYRKLCRRGEEETYWQWWEPPSNCNIGRHVYEHVVGFIRQEGKRLYFRSDNVEDTLLYDFNLQVGDTLPSGYVTPWPWPAHTVTGVDSVWMGGDWRKKFQLDNSPDHSLFEGVGSHFGLLEPTIMPTPSCIGNLVCFGLGDTAYYPEPGDGCDLRVAIREEKTAIDRLHVFPNPTNGRTTISMPRNTTRAILTDATGRAVRHIPIPSTWAVGVDLGMEPQGIYTLHVLAGSGWTTARIVVMH